MKTIVLASSSTARKRLLGMLPLEFECLSPDIDESQQHGETPYDLVHRLSYEKALAIVPQVDENTLIISGDQIAHFAGEVFGKPGTLDKAKQQLQGFSGQCVEFLSGLCVYDTQTKQYEVHIEPTQTYYRTLSNERIDWYLKHDNPIHCAGSIKLESLGICLCNKIVSNDPYALSGLPMLRLTQLLEQFGVKFF